MDPSTFVEHRCFLLCEIFELILDWLPLPQRERTLASLAATCKALNQASTPALWHSLDSLRPLLKLLPSNSWNEVRDESGRSPFLRLVDCDEPVDWTRFNYYARYVRRLNWDPPLSDMYAYSLHELLAHHPPANPLLPQLRTLVFHDGYPCFTLVRFFLTPTLERLKIKSHAIYEPDVVSLMNEVVANHKNLRYLSLDLWRDDGSVLRGGFVFSKRLAAPTDAEASALMSLFRALPDLQVYHGLLNMSAARTEALAALPRLATVHIDIKRAEMKTVAAAARLRVRDPYAGLWFASLTSLSLLFDWLDEDTLVFLGAIQSPALEVLVLYAKKQPTAAELRNRLAVTARAGYRDGYLHCRSRLDGEGRMYGQENNYGLCIDSGAILWGIVGAAEVGRTRREEERARISHSGLDRTHGNLYYRLLVLWTALSRNSRKGRAQYSRPEHFAHSVGNASNRGSVAANARNRAGETRGAGD